MNIWEGIYINSEKGALKEVIVTIAEKDYVFPLNVKVPIAEDTLKLIIGNWEDKSIDREKDLIMARVTIKCPRNKIYRIVNDKAINLFEIIDLPQSDLTEDISQKEKTKKG